MDNENIIELTGEDGDVLKAEYLDTVLVDDQEYVVMVPVNEDGCGDSCGHDGCDCCGEGETEVIIMKVQKNGRGRRISIGKGNLSKKGCLIRRQPFLRCRPFITSSSASRDRMQTASRCQGRTT